MTKKFLMALLTIFVAMIVMFVVIQSMPGDPVDIMATDIMKRQNVQYEIAYERAKSILNYDPEMPMTQRFFNYVKGIVTGNLGTSMTYQRSVASVVGGALPWTLLVVSLSLFLSFAVGVLLGIYIAWKRSKILNAVLIGYQSIFGAIPNYVLGYLLVFLFSVVLGVLPARGAYSTEVTPGFNGPFIRDVLTHACLPVLTYFLTTVAGWIISMKANSLSVLGEDYIITARAKGLREGVVVVRHALGSALIPVLTSILTHIPHIIGGSVVVERIFGWPGMGSLMFSAVSGRDYNVVMGGTVVMALAVLLTSLLLDVVYGLVDPRVRYGER